MYPSVPFKTASPSEPRARRRASAHASDWLLWIDDIRVAPSFLTAHPLLAFIVKNRPPIVILPSPAGNTKSPVELPSWTDSGVNGLQNHPAPQEICCLIVQRYT